MRDLRTPPWAPGARFALAAGALALFGLLSMHGWGSHAGAHVTETLPQGAAGMVASEITGAHGAHAMHADHAPGPDAPGPVDPATDQPAGHGTQEPGGDDGAGLLGLCLAVLTALVLGTALLLALGGIRMPLNLLPAWASPAFIGRDRDPPDLRRLCVTRC